MNLKFIKLFNGRMIFILFIFLALIGIPVVSAASDNTIIGFRWNTSDPSPRLYQIDATGAIIANKDATFWDNWNVTGNMKTVVVTESNNILYGTNNRGDGLDLSGASGDVMVEIPRFYTCSTYANGNFSYWISPLLAPGFTVAPMFNQRGIGSAAGTPAPYYYVGRYDASLSGSKFQSATGKAPAVSITIGQARTYAENKGAGWGITNIWTLSGLRQLFYTEMLTLDSQTAWTKSRGVVDDTNWSVGARPGGADSIDTQIYANNATGSGTGTNGLTPVSYRGIENLWGNVWQIQDGFNAIRGTTNVISPTGLGVTGQKTTFKDVLDATDVQSVGALVLKNDYQKYLMNTDVARPLFLPSAMEGSETTYLSDYYWCPVSTNPGAPCILASGGNWYYAGRAGVGELYAHEVASNSYASIGTRVEFRRSTATGTAPVANFSANVTYGIAPLTVQFTDTSTGSPTSWNWSFGDGSLATVQHPVHTYTTTGIYTVSLNATNAGGSNTKTVTNYITVTAVPRIPVASFTATPTSGTSPLTITFTDNSTNSPTGWNWSFGDNGWFNTSNVLQKNPVHMYTGAGSYTVSLTASNSNGTHTLIKTGYISVAENPSYRSLLILPNASLYQNTPTKIPIQVANITGGTGLSFNLTYNPSVMQVNNITLNPSYASGSNLVVNSTPGLTRVAFTRTDGIDISSPTQLFLLDITGTGAVGSLTQLFANTARWSTSDFDTQQFNVVNGTVLVYRVRGDLNGNGEVDIGDVARVAHMVVGLTPVDTGADFNGNGGVDAGDAAKIAWFSVGKIIEL
jgi:PKD repeat protein